MSQYFKQAQASTLNASKLNEQPQNTFESKPAGIQSVQYHTKFMPDTSDANEEEE